MVRRHLRRRFADEQVDFRQRLVIAGHGFRQADLIVEYRHLAIEQREEVDTVDRYAESADSTVRLAWGRMAVW